MQMKEIRDPAQLDHFLELHQLRPVFGEQLLPHLALYSFEPGEQIYVQGETARTLYVLVQGKLKVYTTSAEGKTLVLLSFKRPLEIIGDIEYLQSIETLNTVEAVTAVRMIGIRYELLEQHGRSHAPLLQFMLQVLARKFLGKSNSLSFNLMYPVDVRFASYLLSVCLDESDEQFCGQVGTEHLVDAANLIGTSYRHLNRVIQQLCADGLIAREKGRIVIRDREGLRALGRQNIYE